MGKYDDELIKIVNENYESNQYIKFEKQRSIRREKRLSDKQRREAIKKGLALALVPILTAAGLIYTNSQMSSKDKLDSSKASTEQQYENEQKGEEVDYSDYIEYTKVTGEDMSKEGAEEFVDTYDKDSFEELMNEYQENNLSKDNSYRGGR